MNWLNDKWLFRLSLLTILIGGLALAIVPLLQGWTGDRGITIELGKSLIIASILGFTIEPWMRRVLARDVFSAAFGYHLPADFKNEIARISSNKIICTRHIMDVVIQSVDIDTVRVCTTVERNFENISNGPVLLRAMTWIDEWGYSENTSITRCEISNETGRRKKEFQPRHIKRFSNMSLRAQSPNMILFPGGKAMTVTETSEIRRQNDHIYIVFLRPTRDPEIRILGKPDELHVEADFGSDQKLKVTGIDGRYQLDGVYFAPAPMRVRWFQKSELTAFLAGAAAP